LIVVRGSADTGGIDINGTKLSLSVGTVCIEFAFGEIFNFVFDIFGDGAVDTEEWVGVGVGIGIGGVVSG